MWGNLLGWAISGVMLLAAAWGIFALEQLGTRTPPTELGRDAANLSRMHLPISPESVGTFMTGSCDAGLLYREAIEAYRNDRAAVERFVSRPTTEGMPAHPALDLLRQASTCRRGVIFGHQPETIIGYGHRRPALVDIHTLGQALVNRGMIKHRTEPQEARLDLQAAFSLGYKLYEERLVFEQLSHGLGLMSSAARYLGRIAEAEGDAAQAQQWREFEESLKQFRLERVDPMWAVISSIGAASIERHAGDIFVFAQDNQEPMWQVEAILKLGRYRFNAPRRADQVAAGRTVRELAHHPDPLINTAATAARDLTIEEYRRMGR